MNHNGNGDQMGHLEEYCKIGLMHSPSGRFLTSENFQGSLNVSGTSLKKKQMWTILIDSVNPTAYFFRNHSGRFLSATNDGKVSLTSDTPGIDERFQIQFDPKASGEIALQSEKHFYYLQWNSNEMRCFSKDPVWWGLRLAIHPQIHLLSVHRGTYVRSAKKDTELKADEKAPQTSKFLLWLEQLPLPNMSARKGSNESLTKQQVAELSHVAIRTQSGLYLSTHGTLSETLSNDTLFSISFKLDKIPVLLFQNDQGEYLTVGAGGILKVKHGVRLPRREEYFSIQSPTIQLRLQAFNNKYACVKHGLNFSATGNEATSDKGSIFQLNYVGGKGLDILEMVRSMSSTSSTDSNQSSFYFPDEKVSPDNLYLPTGLWRLETQNRELWTFPATGVAQLVERKKKENTEIKLLFLSSDMQKSADNSDQSVEKIAGVVMCTANGHTVGAKSLGAIAVTENMIDSKWRPSTVEIFSITPLVNRPSIAIYSPLSCGYIGLSSGKRDSVDCINTLAQQWYIRHLPTGACQLFAAQNDHNWLILTVRLGGSVTVSLSTFGPNDKSASSSADQEFFVYIVSSKHILLRPADMINAKSGYLASDMLGNLKVNTSADVTPACLWQI